MPNREIQFRAKPLDGQLNGFEFLKGCYYYINSYEKTPFQQEMDVRRHFLVSYIQPISDKETGRWEHIEINPNTLQQCTELCDSNGNKIYDGDIIRVYFSVSYDQDGTTCIGNDYIDDIVCYENGAFKLYETNKYLHDIIDGFNIVYINGNVLTAIGNEKALNYRINLLCENFELNSRHNDDMINLAFLEFAREVSEILMDDYACYYYESENELVIHFDYHNNYFLISKEIDTDDNTPYCLKKIKCGHVVNEFNFKNIKDLKEKVYKLYE